MKCSIILIATLFIIGISLSDAVVKKEDKTGGEKTGAAKKGTEKKTPPKETESAKKDDDDDEEESKKDSNTDDDDDSDVKDQDESKVDKKKKGAAKKQTAAKKQAAKKQTAKKQPAKKGSTKKRDSEEDSEDIDIEEDDEDEVEEEVKPRKKKRSPSLKDLENLKDQAASMNPANLIAALKDTPVEELKKVLPQMKKLTNMLDGTPLGPIFGNLTSLLGNSSPQMWTQVFQVFPNFVSTILNSVTQLTSVATMAFGRGLKSIVDIADVLFSGGKDLLQHASMLPGGGLLTPFGQILDLAHGTVVTPVDNAAAGLTSESKRQLKLAQRAASRMRSGTSIGGGLTDINIL